MNEMKEISSWGLAFVFTFDFWTCEEIIYSLDFSHGGAYVEVEVFEP